ncbi:MAG: NYN domain-containing protein, partial [Candidatus Polarisedimenticolia bacterium]
MTTRLWIVDGHNVIFALPDLHRLQIADQGDAARRDLVDRLRRFAQERHEKVLVVFDGGTMLSNPEAVEEPLLEVVFARRGEGEADDRILHEARRRLEEGLLVTVVTRDLRTLAWDLPKGVRHLEVRDFWRKHVKPPEKAAVKRVAGDFSEVEETLAALGAVAEPGP